MYGSSALRNFSSVPLKILIFGSAAFAIVPANVIVATTTADTKCLTPARWKVHVLYIVLPPSCFRANEFKDSSFYMLTWYSMYRRIVRSIPSLKTPSITAPNTPSVTKPTNMMSVLNSMRDCMIR